MDKAQAIKEANKKRIEEAERRFQRRVNGVLEEISEYSIRLRIAKQTLVDMEYKAPTEIDID